MTLPKVARRIRESCRCGWIGYIYGDSVKEKEIILKKKKKLRPSCLKICDIELIQYKFAIRESTDSMVENFAIIRLILTFAKNSELWLEQLQ
jgi:hypothetical protein